MKKVIIFEMLALSCSAILFLLCNAFFENGQIDIVSISVWLVSGIIACWAFREFYLHGIKSYNLFAIIFFTFLHFNTYKLSALQSDITVRDMYYWFMGSGVLLFCLYMADHLKLKEGISPPFTINTNMVVTCILIVYWILYSYIFHRTGIRLFSGIYNNLHGEANQFSLTGFSGIAGMLTMILLFYVPHVEKKYQVIIFISTFGLYGVLSFSRGNCMRVMFFFLIYYLFIQRERLLHKENIRKMILAIVFMLVTFIFFGNIRQWLRWSVGTDNTLEILHTSAEMNIYLGSLLWIWGYTAVNFDVFKLIYGLNPEYSISTLLVPIKRFLGDHADYAEFTLRMDRPEDKFGLGGFNAKTFMADYVLDLGPFFWIEIFLLGVLLSMILLYARNRKLDGLYCYIVSLLAMSIMGDYFISPSIVYAVIAGSVLLFFTVKPDKSLNYEKLT